MLISRLSVLFLGTTLLAPGLASTAMVGTTQQAVDSPPPGQSAPGWIELFDGASLAGWRAVGGGATYTVEDGCILGVVGPGGNAFLRTDRAFDDFELELDLRLDETGNSGIQFRSHQRDGDGRVFGYQCEVDPSERAWSGGVYDEARRGWLAPLGGDEHAAARAAFKATDWNHYRIVARGDHLRTWVNGVACADLHDDVDASGFIALQVHSGETGRIRWKNVRLRELGAAARATWGDDIARSAGRAVSDDGASITIRLDAPVEVDVFLLHEAHSRPTSHRATRFLIEAGAATSAGTTWRQVAAGDAIGVRRVVQVKPVEAKLFRLTVERGGAGDPAAASMYPRFELYKLPVEEDPAASAD